MPDTTRNEQPCGVPPKRAPLRQHASDPAALTRLFDDWMLGDATEQRETFQTLRQSLDETRPPG
jgi:hypothetical protein